MARGRDSITAGRRKSAIGSKGSGGARSREIRRGCAWGIGETRGGRGAQCNGVGDAQEVSTGRAVGLEMSREVTGRSAMGLGMFREVSMACGIGEREVRGGAARHWRGHGRGISGMVGGSVGVIG